jgi:hypothetical protein
VTSPVDALMEALTAHADSLFEPELGERGVSRRDASGLPARALGDLMVLAESVWAVLAPVKPPSAYVDELERKLREAASVPPIEISTPGPSWVVGAAAVGSVLSLLGLYHLLRRGRHPLRRAS